MQVTERDVIELPEDRWREAFDLFMTAVHMPATDDRWEAWKPFYAPGRTLGVLGDGAALGRADELLGTLTSMDAGIAVPGGAVVSMMSGTAGGVRADRTRNGILAAMIRAELGRMAERGVVVSGGRPSEGGIYGRFGWACAARTQEYRIDGFRAKISDQVPSSEQVRLLTVSERRYDELMKLIPSIYRRAALHRPGAYDRPDAWWVCWGPFADRHNPPGVAVHEGPDGPDGYVMWVVEYVGEEVASTKRVLHIAEMAAANPTVEAALWRFVVELDLVEEIRARDRPLDDTLPLLLTDPRACRTVDVVDEAWIRLIDVPAALSARAWNASGRVEPVVIEVADRFIDRNTGTYRITSDGVEKVDVATDLRFDVRSLSKAYLGDVPPTRLAAVGWVDVVEPAALARADALFAVEQAPLLGAFF